MGVSPSFALVALGLWASAALPLPTGEAERSLVLGVELRLPAGTSPALLRAEEARELVAVRKGQRLSLTAVRRSIERLLASGRFSDVVVRALDVPGGVEVIFELVPKRFLAGVSVQGARALPPQELLAAAKLSRGAEYYPERVQEAQEAVLEAYRRRGYQRAKVSVELEEVEGGLEAQLLAEEGEPTRLLGITAAGSPGLPLPRLLLATGLSVGEVLDLEKVEAGLERLRELYRAEAYYRARVGEPQVLPAREGAVLLLPLSAGPKYQLLVQGHRTFPQDLLKGILGYQGGEPMERGVAARLARRLEAFYRFQGFHDAQVGARERQSPDGKEAVLVFQVDEGRPLFVREVVFSGNRELASAELRAILSQMVQALTPRPAGRGHASHDPLRLEGRGKVARHTDPPEPDPAAIFVESAYAQAAEAMTTLYRERGFLSAQVSLARVSIEVEEKTAAVSFEVQEGPRAMVREVLVRGLPQELGSKSPGLKVAEPLRYALVEEERAALARALSRRGYLFARVEAQTEVSPSGEEARVRFLVEAGQQVRVGKVLVQGAARTRETVIRDALPLKEGEVLDPERLFEAQRNLALLGIFRNVSVTLIAPERVEPVKDVAVEVRELTRGFADASFGYSLAEGPRLVADGAIPNLAGRALNLSGRGKLYYIGGSAQAISGLIDTSDLQGLDFLGGRLILSGQGQGPWLLPREVDARIDLLTERVHKPWYRFTRFAAVPGLDFPVTFEVPRTLNLGLVKIPPNPQARLSFGLQYELEHDRVSGGGSGGQLLPTLASSDQERLRFPFGLFSLHSLRLAPALDLRDSAVSPRAGLLLSGSLEWMRDIATTLGSPIHTLKASGALSVYRELFPSWVLAVSLRGGRFFPLDPASVTIAPKRFFLGGASSMRGFREDGLIPAERRSDLRREVASCTALANQAGCTPAAAVLLQGLEVPSEGGEVFALSKAELRFPALWPDVELGVFVETGNLWLSPRGVNLKELRYVAGAGLRYSALGPAALDFGINLFPDHTVNEPTFNLHFNIGLF